LLSTSVLAVVILGSISALAWGFSRGSGKKVLAEVPAAHEALRPQIYDEKTDGHVLVNAALAKAKIEHHYVLVQWGGNWCSWCIVLHALYEKDPEISKLLRDKYELVMLDTNDRNMPMVKELGASMEHGVPYLTILNADGKPLVQQETESLEVKNAEGKSAGVSAGHDREKVLAFLKSHATNP